MHTEMTRNTSKRPRFKPLAERNKLTVGPSASRSSSHWWWRSSSNDRIPFIKGTTDHSAYFAEAAGIKPGSDVRVSGLGVGRVSGHQPEGTKVLIDFTVRDGVDLGDRTEAAIGTETVLGTKYLELTPRGDGTLNRTHSTGTQPLAPTIRPRRSGDLTTTISGLDTAQLSSALTTMADTFRDTPAPAEARPAGWPGSPTRSTPGMPSCGTCWPMPKGDRCAGQGSDQIANWSPTPTRCWLSLSPSVIRWTP